MATNFVASKTQTVCDFAIFAPYVSVFGVDDRSETFFFQKSQKLSLCEMMTRV